jgi:hypothetical protein
MRPAKKHSEYLSQTSTTSGRFVEQTPQWPASDGEVAVRQQDPIAAVGDRAARRANMDDAREAAAPLFPIGRAGHDERHAPLVLLRIREERVIRRPDATGLFVIGVRQMKRRASHVMGHCSSRAPSA